MRNAFSAGFPAQIRPIPYESTATHQGAGIISEGFEETQERLEKIKNFKGPAKMTKNVSDTTFMSQATVFAGTDLKISEDPEKEANDMLKNAEEGIDQLQIRKRAE